MSYNSYKSYKSYKIYKLCLLQPHHFLTADTIVCCIVKSLCVYARILFAKPEIYLVKNFRVMK